jgi:ribosomal protein S18 acetylase RimI-like enzyme
MISAIALRPIKEEDIPLLLEIYATTREELQFVPWDDERKRVFVSQQFMAQHTYYHQHFARADFDLIVLDSNKPIGRLYVDRREDEIQIIDITLLPEFREQGIGTSLLRDLLEEAASAGKPLRLHVGSSNRAKSLYQRLGFREIRENGVYSLMEWKRVVSDGVERARR